MTFSMWLGIIVLVILGIGFAAVLFRK